MTDRGKIFAIYGTVAVLSALIIAVAVGLLIGVAGRILIRRVRSAPMWLPVAAAVGASVMAAIVAGMAGLDRSGPTAAEVVLQMLFAAAGVVIVAATADPPVTTVRTVHRPGRSR